MWGTWHSGGSQWGYRFGTILLEKHTSPTTTTKPLKGAYKISFAKVQDDKEAYLNIEKLNKSDEDQKYIDQVYDYYNGNLVENVAEKVIKRKNR